MELLWRHVRFFDRRINARICDAEYGRLLLQSFPWRAPVASSIESASKMIMFVCSISAAALSSSVPPFPPGTHPEVTSVPTYVALLRTRSVSTCGCPLSVKMSAAASRMYRSRLRSSCEGERLDASFSAALSAGLNAWSQRPNEANGANTQSPEALTQRMDKEAPATNDFHVCGVRAEGAGRLDIPTGLGSVRGSLNGVSPM